MSTRISLCLLWGCLVTSGAAYAADPPVPSGAHPRLFLTTANLATLKSNAATDGTAAHAFVGRCQDTLDHAADYDMRGGSDGDNWPGAALSCALAYLTSQNAQFLTQALKYWHASLDDDQMINDHMGCVAGVSNAWQSWDGNPPAPPVIRTITHDTGYPLRWYGPDIALVYDWLYEANGVDDALRAQTRTCLTAWSDYYTQNGYNRDEAGANYNAGFVIAKTLSAIAIGNDGSADGHLWTETLDDVFGKLLIGQGLMGSVDSPLGSPVGPILGGDWGEGWQYGPLSVIEYAAATLALEQNGASLPQMDAWLNSLMLRNIYSATPPLDGQFCGDGDCDVAQPNQDPSANQLDAVLLGPSSDEAASWAAFMKAQQNVSGNYVYNALAELRSAKLSDYRAQTPAPPLWYLARGTRSMFVRTGWDANAFWAVFTSPPTINSGHQHFNAGDFVFSRGADALIVDPAPYGGYTTWDSNAVTADAKVVMGDYAPSQTPWSKAELSWARGTSDAVFAARSDFARAFDYTDTSSDVSYAHREWVMLPEGEIATIDRVHTSAASRNVYFSLHTNTGGGKLMLNNGVAVGRVGDTSQVAIHPVLLSSGTPAITQPSTKDCTLSCSYPCAKCDTARFAVDKYAVTLNGPWAVAIHVIDGFAAAATPAQVGSLNDDNFDPAPKQNGGVIGAAIYRESKQSYVVASSAMDGASPAMMKYGVPGNSPARHIVFDAPEASDGTSSVTAAAQNGRCVLTIAAGSGGGFKGHPLMFSVSDAAGGCVASDNTDVAPGSAPPGGGTMQLPPKKGSSKGCACALGGGASGRPSLVVLLLPLLTFAWRHRARR
jgi:hypothetical protein